MTLRYYPHQSVPLGDSIEQMLKHLYRVWGFEVKLEQKNTDGEIETLATCPTRAKKS